MPQLFGCFCPKRLWTQSAFERLEHWGGRRPNAPNASGVKTLDWGSVFRYNSLSYSPLSMDFRNNLKQAKNGTERKSKMMLAYPKADQVVNRRLVLNKHENIGLLLCIFEHRRKSQVADGFIKGSCQRKPATHSGVAQGQAT